VKISCQSIWCVLQPFILQFDHQVRLGFALCA
jgi:hypothetical protein